MVHRLGVLTDALARGIHELVITDTPSYRIAFNPNTLRISIEQRRPRHLEGFIETTLQHFFEGDPSSLERDLKNAGASWLFPLLRRLANGEFVRIAEIEHAGGAAGAGRPVARAFDGSLVPRDRTWKGPPPPVKKRPKRKRR